MLSLRLGTLNKVVIFFCFRTTGVTRLPPLGVGRCHSKPPPGQPVATVSPLPRTRVWRHQRQVVPKLLPYGVQRSGDTLTQEKKTLVKSQLDTSLVSWDHREGPNHYCHCPWVTVPNGPCLGHVPSYLGRVSLCALPRVAVKGPCRIFSAPLTAGEVIR